MTLLEKVNNASTLHRGLLRLANTKLIITSNRFTEEEDASGLVRVEVNFPISSRQRGRLTLDLPL